MELGTEFAVLIATAIGLVFFTLRTRAEQERLNVEARKYIQDKVEDQDKKISRLEKERESLIVQLTDTRDKQSFAEGLSQGRLERIEKQDQRILDLRAEFEHQKDELAQLKTLPGRLTDLQTQHNKILIEFKSAKEQNATLLQQNEQLRRDLKAERDMNASLREQLRELGAKLDKSNIEIERLSAQLDQINREYREVRKQLDAMDQPTETIETNEVSEEAA